MRGQDSKLKFDQGSGIGTYLIKEGSLIFDRITGVS